MRLHFRKYEAAKQEHGKNVSPLQRNPSAAGRNLLRESKFQALLFEVAVVPPCCHNEWSLLIGDELMLDPHLAGARVYPGRHFQFMFFD
ncbi:hypothetical protein V3C99_011155 [Haemonchus contortus]